MKHSITGPMRAELKAKADRKGRTALTLYLTRQWVNSYRNLLFIFLAKAALSAGVRFNCCT